MLSFFDSCYVKKCTMRLRGLIFIFLLFLVGCNIIDKDNSLKVEKINKSRVKYTGKAIGENQIELKGITLRELCFILNEELDTLVIGSKIKKDIFFNVYAKSTLKKKSLLYLDILAEICDKGNLIFSVEDKDIYVESFEISDESILNKSLSVADRDSGLKEKVQRINNIIYFQNISLHNLAKNLTSAYDNHFLFVYKGDNRNKYNFQLPLNNPNFLKDKLLGYGIFVKKTKQKKTLKILYQK